MKISPFRFLLVNLAVVAAVGHTDPSLASTPTVISTMDLQEPFRARSPWKLTISRGPDVDGILSDPDKGIVDKMPGVVTLCIHTIRSRECDHSLSGDFDQEPDRYFAASHVLTTARLVRPRSVGERLLLVQTTNLPSGDGNVGILTQVIAYDRGKDRFRRVFRHVTGSNNNQEVRYISGGLLRGDIIVAEPTPDAPYAYWITVYKLSGPMGYRPVLRYRSATTYNDGNSLAVIDSEMPNIQARLGISRPGNMLPLPASGCPKARLARSELWCGDDHPSGVASNR